MPLFKYKVEEVTPDFDIDEQISLHEKGWVVQRIGWVVIFLIVLLASLGLFGEGPLSKKSITAGSFHLQYNYFLRYEANLPLKVTSLSQHIATISLSQHYLQQFKVDKITPEPEKVVTTPGFITYTFSGNANQHVMFYIVPEYLGSVKGTIKVNNQTFSLSHFIYP